MKCGDPDNDKDGYREVDGDCDDTNKLIFPGPGAKEKCGDFVDQNCDGYEKVCVEAQPLDIFDRIFPEIEKPGGSWSPIDAWSPMGLENLRKAEQWVASLVSTLVILSARTEPFGTAQGKLRGVRSNKTIRALPAGRQEANTLPDATASGSEGSQFVFTPPPASTVGTHDTAPAKTLSTTTVSLYYTFGDHLGSSSVTLDASGNLMQVTDYFPYGGVNVDEKYGSFANPYTYTGKERDEEIDLYYYGARYYNAGFSRFTSVDPALFDAQHLLSILADPQSLNSYAYARNNPMIYVDPDGNAILPFLSKMLGKIGGAIGVLVSFFLSYETANAPAPRMQTVSSPSNVELFATLTIGEIGGEVFGRFLGKFFSVIKGIFTAKVLTETVEEGGEQIIKRSLQIQNRALASDIVKTFQKGEYNTIILDEDITAYRIWGGTSEEISDFFGIEKPIKNQADELFNLPSGNTQENLTTFTISKGTEVNIGQVEGGKGMQLVIPNAKNNPGIKVINKEEFK